jgi:hypothetical protein
VKDLIIIILKKKELQGISEEIVLKEINRNINPKIRGLVEKKRHKSKEFKDFVKKIRAQLRRQFGAFNNPKINRQELIKKMDYEKLLQSHQSSKERMPYYKEVYSKIFGQKPASIMDLGCGFNPLSIEYMQFKPIKYLALDINENDLKIINEYFMQKKINGKAEVFDASNLKNYESLDYYDFCFAFKLFEILETSKSHRLTEEIILRIPAKIIIASFSTKTLSGAPMSKKRRVWFEVMSKRLGFRIDSFQIPNELFYILSR